VNPNQQQSEAWNGPESVHYVEHADRYDRQLMPITDAIIERSALGPTDIVLDVGCGSGVTTFEAARRARRVVGVDISEPLVGVAVARSRDRAIDNAEFLVADAQTHDFDDARFDVVLSQFGLMFFDEPVRAFSNLRCALDDDGRIVFATWRRLDDNEWLAPVVRAVAEHADVPDLGGLANGAGMFALKDRSEIAELLTAARFTDVSVEALSPTLLVGGGGGVDECAAFLLGTGIVRGLLSRLDDIQMGAAIEMIRAELGRRHTTGDGVRLGAGAWLVSAHR
jgi:ubiquinone/menaquinone biosynthesis C-methylase UbiE